MEPLKVNFIHMLQLLASAEEQDMYQSEVVSTDIADELRCMWFDDFSADVERERMAPLLTSEELRRVDEFHAFYKARVEQLPRNYIGAANVGVVGRSDAGGRRDADRARLGQGADGSELRRGLTECRRNLRL